MAFARLFAGDMLQFTACPPQRRGNNSYWDRFIIVRLRLPVPKWIGWLTHCGFDSKEIFKKCSETTRSRGVDFLILVQGILFGHQ